MASHSLGAIPKKLYTRSSSAHHFLFGNLTTFSGTQLPTEFEVGKAFFCLFNSRKGEGTLEELERIIITELAYEIISIWKKTSIPIKSNKDIINKVSYFVKTKLSKLRKMSSLRRLDAKVIENMRAEFEKLFNCASCQCLMDCKDFCFKDLKCSCSEIKKIPTEEMAFLMDQLTERKLFLTKLPSVSLMDVCEANPQNMEIDNAKGNILSNRL
jgi:hypothetical protein